MKKTILHILLISFATGTTVSQVNLVPNGGFEIIDSCNLQAGAIYLGTVPPWDSPTYTSPDAFNTCSSNLRIPNNGFGYQHTHNGNGYAGSGFYGLQSNGVRYLEYIQVELDSILLAQKQYCVNFYVNFAEISNIAINNIGMYFSYTHINMPSYTGTLNFVPQINETNIVNDTSNWTMISGQFIANGGERYIIVGDFYPDSLTLFDTLPTIYTYKAAYYYIDDVNVHCCNCDSTSHIGINEAKEEEGIEVYPNPATEELRITNYELGINEVKIYNVLGMEIRNYELRIRNEKSITIDVSAFAKGIYFIEVQTEKVTARRKFVKQ